jgi:hypothetical protein
LQSAQCSFFEWREVYACTVQRNAGDDHGQLAAPTAGPAPPARGTNHPDLAHINLLVSLINTMAVMLMLAVLLDVTVPLIGK